MKRTLINCTVSTVRSSSYSELSSSIISSSIGSTRFTSTTPSSGDGVAPMSGITSTSGSSAASYSSRGSAEPPSAYDNSSRGGFSAASSAEAFAAPSPSPSTSTRNAASSSMLFLLAISLYSASIDASPMDVDPFCGAFPSTNEASTAPARMDASRLSPPSTTLLALPDSTTVPSTGRSLFTASTTSE